MGKDTALCPNGMDVAKLTHKKVLQTLENGVRFGKWVLLENIGEVGTRRRYAFPRSFLTWLQHSRETIRPYTSSNQHNYINTVRRW